MGQIKEIIPVVIDTNVVVSALLFRGVPGGIIPLWKSGKITPHASREIVDEYLRVLAYPKFQLSEEEIQYLLHQEILPWFETVETCKTSQSVIIANDPSDDKFIRCAKAADVQLVISGDHHLLSLQSHGRIEIVTPASLLKLLR